MQAPFCIVNVILEIALMEENQETSFPQS